MYGCYLRCDGSATPGFPVVFWDGLVIPVPVSDFRRRWWNREFGAASLEPWPHGSSPPWNLRLTATFKLFQIKTAVCIVSLPKNEEFQQFVRWMTRRFSWKDREWYNRNRIRSCICIFCRSGLISWVSLVLNEQHWYSNMIYKIWDMSFPCFLESDPSM